ncbi:MAG TPA: hypothetical protein V6D13_18460 [Halomicronema sp.]
MTLASKNPPAPDRSTCPTPYTGPLEFHQRCNNLLMPVNRA